MQLMLNLVMKYLSNLFSGLNEIIKFLYYLRIFLVMYNVI